MMNILMSETCWAHKKWNKIASDMKLFFYSSKWATFEITNTWKIQNCILSLGGFLRRLVRSAGLQVLLVSILCQYRGADRSLTRSGRKQARKHVRDARDFNNIETRAVIRFFFFSKARHRRKFTPFLQKHYLVSFLVRLRTYQHPCTTFCHRFRAFFRSSWSPRSPVWAKTVDTRSKCVPNIAHVRHADWMIFRHLSAL